MATRDSDGDRRRVYVLGEARAVSGGATLAKPQKGALVISTRSEEEFTRSAKRTVVLAGLAAAVFAVLGVGLLFAALAG